MKIKAAHENPSILDIYIIDIEGYYNYSLNAIISLVTITYFHFVTRMLFI